MGRAANGPREYLQNCKFSAKVGRASVPPYANLRRLAEHAPPMLRITIYFIKKSSGPHGGFALALFPLLAKVLLAS
jgi:hypothetical protein